MDVNGNGMPILSIESPFSWKVPDTEIPVDLYLKSQEEKYESTSEETQFGWMKYLLNLLLSYEYYAKKKDLSKSLQHLKNCEEHLELLSRENCVERLFVNMKQALWHVTLATKLHILTHSNSIGLAEKQSILDRIPALNGMEARDKAGIAGIKAGLYIQYGTPGHRLALESARKAHRLDPDQAEWCFLIGNALGRLRRSENASSISSEELEMIKQAYLLGKDASYTVHLAQTYADLSRQSLYSRNYGKCKDFSKKSIEHFQEAIKMRPNCGSLMARVAHGMMRIKCRDVNINPQYIKDLLEEVIRITPNNGMAFQDLGFYYEKFEKKNLDRALEAYDKANKLGNNKALLSLVGLKWKLNQDEEIINDLKKGVLRYNDISQAELLMNLGISHILIANDWKAGIECILEYLDLQPSGHYLKNCGGFDGKRTDVLHIITIEILLKTLNAYQIPLELQELFLDKSKPISPKSFDEHVPKRSLFSSWKNNQLKVKFNN